MLSFQDPARYRNKYSVFFFFGIFLSLTVDYRRRLVSGRRDGHADAGPLRIDPAGRQLLAQQRRSVHLHGSLGGSRPANSVHDCPTAFAILFPIGRPRLHLRPDRIGNLGQKDAGRGSSTSGLASSSLQAQGTVPYKVPNQNFLDQRPFDSTVSRLCVHSLPFWVSSARDSQKKHIQWKRR